LTKDEIEKSPVIDADKPVSRQQETELHKYYNWAAYWSGPFGLVATPVGPVSIDAEKKASVQVQEKAQNHLRSTKEVIGYNLHASDGKIGLVDDFIIHEENWLIRYMIVDTTRWFMGKKVIIPPDWISEIDWQNAEVYVDVSKETVRKSPQFNPSAPVNREYEIRLYDYYGRPKYWSG
ncbi:MAG: PRC-barrel domain-containing protein, partial [Phycisphaerales bacterium]